MATAETIRRRTICERLRRAFIRKMTPPPPPPWWHAPKSGRHVPLLIVYDGESIPYHLFQDEAEWVEFERRTWHGHDTGPTGPEMIARKHAWLRQHGRAREIGAGKRQR